MKKYSIIYYVFFLLLCLNNINAQTFKIENLNDINLMDLSDQELIKYLEDARLRGYDTNRLIEFATFQGVSKSKIDEFKNRIALLENYNDKDNIIIKDFDLEQNELGIKSSNDVVTQEPSNVFGLDFFNNPKINFTPNINVATPKTYVLGPGDNLIIDIWGASEITYDLEVDRYGAIKIEKIGPVYVGGLQINDAKNKIISYLKKIYSGIDNVEGSNKVYTDVSVSRVRTVNVNIIGEIKVPGTYSLSALSTIVNALYSAGGPTENGSMREIELYRDGKKKSVFDIYDYLIKGNQTDNIFLEDQDLIIIKPFINRVLISGEVKKPGLFELKNDEKFDDLLNFSGGFKSTAFNKSISIERINGQAKVIKEINQNEFNLFNIQDGDIINVKKTADNFINRYSVEGPVYNSGDFEFEKGLKISDVIDKKIFGFKPEIYNEKAIIYRTEDFVNFEILSFNPKNILEYEEDFNIRVNDRIKFFSKSELEYQSFLTVNGAVNYPQTIDFIMGASLEDIIAIAGGFKFGADISRIDIFRRVLDKNSETLTESFSFSVKEDLTSLSDFKLMPNDIVTVRLLTGIENLKNISIQGKVKFPGFYSLENSSSTVTSLIESAGGFEKNADLDRAYIERVVDLNNKLNKNDVDSLFIENKSQLYKIPVNLSNLNNGMNGNLLKNLVFKDGDVLYIPEKETTVLVEGEVLNPSLINFEKKYSFKQYISLSGGFKSSAKKSKVYVVSSSGKSKSTKKFLFFNLYPRIEAGSTIIVPSKQEKNNKLSLGEIISISTALGTLGVLIKSL